MFISIVFYLFRSVVTLEFYNILGFDITSKNQGIGTILLF